MHSATVSQPCGHYHHPFIIRHITSYTDASGQRYSRADEEAQQHIGKYSRADDYSPLQGRSILDQIGVLQGTYYLTSLLVVLCA